MAQKACQRGDSNSSLGFDWGSPLARTCRCGYSSDLHNRLFERALAGDDLG